MMIDENEFFRQATLRICGDLEIEQAMCACIQFLQQVMPADRMYLELYEQGFTAMRTIATATPSEGRKLDRLIHLSEELRAHINYWKHATEQDVVVLENPEAEPVSRELMQVLRIKCTSLLGMALKIGGRRIGNLVLITEGTEKYTREHARLLSLLREPFTIAMSNALKHREVIELKDVLADDNRFFQEELRRLSGEEIIGANFGLQQVINAVRKVAVMDSPVLLLGDTGVGKEVIANTIHTSSPRNSGPFIKVNCGAIPESLIDSELFGHEKGAFTGALSQKRRRFERAHNGTLFLDEIGELPPQAQVRLLRVLQHKEIERVGGTKTIAVDIRIIAATHRDLEEMVKTGQFREDLWFRLNVFPITIPPLRERRSDIPALVQHFINKKVRELQLPSILTVTAGAIDRLMAYAWPGNVRELENVVEREMILNPDGPLTFDHVNPDEQPEARDLDMQHETSDNLDEVISRHIQYILRKTQGKIYGLGGAAELLGVNPNTLRNRMNKLGIKYGRKEKRNL